MSKKTKTTDGGPAFPTPPPLPFDTGLRHGGLGMSLRDWLAGQALCGIAGAVTEMTSRQDGENSGELLLKAIKGVGPLAYALADAALAAGNKEGQTELGEQT